MRAFPLRVREQLCVAFAALRFENMSRNCYLPSTRKYISRVAVAARAIPQPTRACMHFLSHSIDDPVRAALARAEAYNAIQAGEVKKGCVLIIRYEGPVGSPGMPEMLSPGAALVGAGLGPHVALGRSRFITLGCFSCLRILHACCGLKMTMLITVSFFFMIFC